MNIVLNYQSNPALEPKFFVEKYRAVFSLALHQKSKNPHRLFYLQQVELCVSVAGQIKAATTAKDAIAEVCAQKALYGSVLFFDSFLLDKQKK